MSVDHKPNSREERSRIEDAGGVVVWAGTWRVGGVLAVSRAFGDRPLKRYVIPTPDIRDESLTQDDDCLILASDGLWDVVSNQVRASRTHSFQPAANSSEHIYNYNLAVHCTIARLCRVFAVRQALILARLAGLWSCSLQAAVFLR
jgi:serine/threonine protein phosphatase PrpC